MSRTNHALTAVGLYIAAVWVLYGRKEVLPKALLEAYKPIIGADKRDPKQLQYFRRHTIGQMGKHSVKSVYLLSEALKKSAKTGSA